MKQIQIQKRSSGTRTDEQQEHAFATQADRELARARRARDRAAVKAAR